MLKTEVEYLLVESESGQICPRHHKEIMSTRSTGAQLKQCVETKVCCDYRERTAELSRGHSPAVCCPPVLRLLHGRTSPLSVLLMEELILTADVAAEKR